MGQQRRNGEPLPEQPGMQDSPSLHATHPSRKAATIANLLFQYVTIGLAIIRGFLLVPLYLRYIDYRMYAAWLATGNVVSWLTIAGGKITSLVRQQVAAAQPFQAASP